MPRNRFYIFPAVTVGLLAALFVVLARPQSTYTALSFLILAPCVPVSLRLIQRCRDWLTRQDLFSPLIGFPLAYVVWFFIGSTDLIDLPSSISFGAFDPIPRKVLVYAGIGLIGYLCGVKLALPARKKISIETIPTFRNTWKPGIALILVGLASVMFGAYVYIVSRIGLIILQPDAAASRLSIVEYHLAATAFGISGYTLFLFLLCLFWAERDSTSSSKNYRFLFGAAAVLILFLSLGSRSAFFIMILTALVLYNYLAKPLRLGKLLLTSVALFGLLGVYGYTRDASVASNMPELVEQAGVPQLIQPFLYCYLYIRYPVATFRDVTTIIPAQRPYQHGGITFLPFASLLPGHHEMSDFYFKDLLGNEFLGAGQPATLLGPFYADFGPVGIFLGMFGYGVLLARLYRWMITARTVFSVLVFSWITQVGLFSLFSALFSDLGTILMPLIWAVVHLLLRGAPGPESQLSHLVGLQPQLDRGGARAQHA